MKPLRTLFALLPLLFAAMCLGQKDLAAPPLDPSYIVGPEDVLVVTTRDILEASGEFLVRHDGKISFPFVGELKVEGLTVPQVTDLLTEKLKKELKSPEVYVSVKSMRTNRIYVLGSVNQAGMLDWKQGWRLTELISAAGGLKGLPERLTAVIWRKGEAAKTIKLYEIFIDGKEESNVEVKPGDTVDIHDKPVLRITVTGKVEKQGIVDVLQGDGAAEAVAAMGGAKPDGALSKSKIIRKGREIPVDLYRAILLGDSTKNVAVEDGDIVNVPENQAKVAVIGRVDKPGPVVIPDGRELRLTEALREAGGPISEAKIDAVTLSRKSANGAFVAKAYNLKSIAGGAKGSDDPILQDGDIVMVAQSGRANGGMINQVLGLIGQFWWRLGL